MISIIIYSKNITDHILQLTSEPTYAKVHGSVSVDALQRKESEESACGKVHDPVFKITGIYFQEKLLCNLEMSMHNFVEIFLE